MITHHSVNGELLFTFQKITFGNASSFVSFVYSFF